MRRKVQNKSRKNKSRRSKRSHRKRTHRKRHIRGGNYDQETTKTLEGVPIESDEITMVAGDGFSMSAGEYKDMMERLDRDGYDY
jgi:hypothetical protein